MSVRSKFKCMSYKSSLQTTFPHLDQNEKIDYTKPEYVEMRTLEFTPVYGNGDPAHENTKFWQATPQGSVILGTVNPGAWQQFEIGKEYYLDFTLAE